MYYSDPFLVVLFQPQNTVVILFPWPLPLSLSPCASILSISILTNYHNITPYQKSLDAKKKCYPPNLSVSNTYAVMNLQAMIDHIVCPLLQLMMMNEVTGFCRQSGDVMEVVNGYNINKKEVKNVSLTKIFFR